MATQPNPDYTLTGRTTNRQSEPLEGLIVRAYDQNPKTPENPLGKEGVTGVEGRYNVGLTGKDFQVGGMESGGPDVFIRMYDGDELWGESLGKRNSEKRMTIVLRMDYVEFDPNERPVTYALAPLLDAEGG